MRKEGKKWGLKLLAVLIMLCMAVSVCGAAAPDATEKDPPKIAWICADLTAETWANFEKGVNKQAEELGLETPVAYNAQNDANEQLKLAQDCVTIGYDAVGLFANDNISCSAAVKELNEAGIPVVIIYITPDDKDLEYGAFIDSAQKEGAYESAKVACQEYVDRGMTGTVAHMTISLARENGVMRKQGLVDALDEIGLEISHEKEAEYYTIEEAYNYITDMLTADDDISMVFANYDQAILGAQQAVADAGKEGEVIVAGMDSTTTTLDLLADGKITCTSAQQMYAQGIQMTQACYDLTQNGGESLGTLLSDFLLVTQDSTEEELDKVYLASFGIER